MKEKNIHTAPPPPKKKKKEIKLYQDTIGNIHVILCPYRNLHP